MFRAITPLVSIIIAVVVTLSFAKPMLGEVRALRSETDLYNKATEDAMELNNHLAALITEKRGHSASDLERLGAFVPAEIDEVTILADLASIAKAHSLLFGNVNLNEEDKSESAAKSKKVPDTRGADSRAVSEELTYEDFESSNISFAVIGSYEQFKSFLSDIERSLVLMEIVNISVMSSETGLQQFEVTVRAYALPANKE